jgi:hypothetical protein
MRVVNDMLFAQADVSIWRTRPLSHAASVLNGLPIFDSGVAQMFAELLVRTNHQGN